MTPEENAAQPKNGSNWMTQAVCKETVKRIDGDMHQMRCDISTNSQRVDKLHLILVSTLATSFGSLIGVVVILFKVAI